MSPNCVQNRIAGAALGRSYYLEWLPDPAIIVLEGLSGHWMLASIHGPHNAPVSAAVKSAIWAKLRPLGVLVRATDAHAGYWNPVAELLGYWDFDGSFGFAEAAFLELFPAA